MQYYDAITNPRWRTAAYMKSLCRHISVKNDPVTMKFCTVNQTVTLIKRFFLTKILIFKFKMADGH